MKNEEWRSIFSGGFPPVYFSSSNVLEKPSAPLAARSFRLLGVHPLFCFFNPLIPKAFFCPIYGTKLKPGPFRERQLLTSIEMSSSDDIFEIYIQNAIESYIGMTTVSLQMESYTCSTNDKKSLFFIFLCFCDYG